MSVGMARRKKCAEAVDGEYSKYFREGPAPADVAQAHGENGMAQRCGGAISSAASRRDRHWSRESSPVSRRSVAASGAS